MNEKELKKIFDIVDGIDKLNLNEKFKKIIEEAKQTKKE